jgi:hypothetical protein
MLREREALRSLWKSVCHICGDREAMVLFFLYYFLFLRVFAIQFFDTFFIVRFLFSLEIGLSLGDYLFISAKFLSSKHWGSDLEKTVDGEAIGSLIHTMLTSFCEPLHCLDETALFSSSNGPVFS